MRQGDQGHLEDVIESPSTAENLARYLYEFAKGRLSVVSSTCRIWASCTIVVRVTADPYRVGSESLGEPLDNMLCLCPNHHVLFDHGGVIVNDDLTLAGGKGRIKVDRRHQINEEHLRYRREHYQFDS